MTATISRASTVCSVVRLFLAWVRAAQTRDVLFAALCTLTKGRRGGTGQALSLPLRPLPTLRRGAEGAGCLRQREAQADSQSREGLWAGEENRAPRAWITHTCSTQVVPGFSGHVLALTEHYVI